MILTFITSHLGLYPQQNSKNVPNILKLYLCSLLVKLSITSEGIKGGLISLVVRGIFRRDSHRS